MRATMIFFALFTVMVLVIAGCNNQSNDGDDMTLDDITGRVVDAKDTPAYDDDPGKVSAGDTVSVMFVGKLKDGEVFDTNIESVATEAGLENIHTDPLTFKVGSGQTIAGFDAAVVGMQPGETKTVEIPPEEAYGGYNMDLVQEFPKTRELNRTDQVDRTTEIPTDAFNQAFGEDPEMGKTYSDERLPFDYEVTGISGDNIELSVDQEIGDTVTFSGADWESEIISMDNDYVTIRHNPEDGQMVESIFGMAKITLTDDKMVIEESPKQGDVIQTMYGNAVIKEVTDDVVLLDMNHELAGETLVFEIEVTDIEKKQKVTKPEVELFVMSHCPYGTQIVKGMIPVMETLGDKADIQVKFVNYAMHGKVELDEQLNQYCIQEEFPDEYVDYLKCFLQEGDTDSCLDEIGIDEDALQECIEETDEEYKVTELFEDQGSWRGGRFPQFNIHDMENQEYGVQGSPTLVINGEVASAGRDPASLLAAICSTYADAPDECSSQLSSETPSPGFGFDPSASGAESGTCG